MNAAIRSIITATGCHIPAAVVPNESFLEHDFRDPDGQGHDKSTAEVIEAFRRITGIAERRYAPEGLVASDLAVLAAREALEGSDIDPESLDQLIVAHNFGDVGRPGDRSDVLPALAARVKQKLGIRNPATVAYDVLFGCPGWLQALIQADAYLRAGDARRVLVIGSETLSRVVDPHDRDSMIFADGAGAVVLEAVAADEPVGILAHVCRTDAVAHAGLLHMGPSHGPEADESPVFLKMDGHAVYEYALEVVPATVKQCLDKAGVGFEEVEKVLLHQANAKMDEAILRRLARLCGARETPRSVMPMTISWLGNSSVATVPTLLDLLRRGRLEGHRWRQGAVYVLASVGAGMNVNAAVYRCP